MRVLEFLWGVFELCLVVPFTSFRVLVSLSAFVSLSCRSSSLCLSCVCLVRLIVDTLVVDIEGAAT